MYHDRFVPIIHIRETYMYVVSRLSPLFQTNAHTHTHTHTNSFFYSHAIQSQQYADMEDDTLQVEQREREMRQLEVLILVI